MQSARNLKKIKISMRIFLTGVPHRVSSVVKPKELNYQRATGRILKIANKPIRDA